MFRYKVLPCLVKKKVSLYFRNLEILYNLKPSENKNLYKNTLIMRESICLRKFCHFILRVCKILFKIYLNAASLNKCLDSLTIFKMLSK